MSIVLYRFFKQVVKSFFLLYIQNNNTFNLKLMILELVHSLNNIFHSTIPLFILINFILLIICICLNLSYFRSFFKKISPQTWILLFIIFFLALILRIFLVSHYHIMYIDEWLYMRAGKDILLDSSQYEYLKSIAWPFILTISFGIFRISNWVALYISSILGALTIFNIFFLSFLISKNEKLSLISASIFSLIPVHLKWSGSAETNVPSIFFITMALFFCFLYYQKKSNSLLWLSLISLAFVAQFRPENYIFPVLFLLGFFIFRINILKKLNFKFVLPLILLIILSSANLFQVLDYQLSTNWIESDTRGIQSGNNWSLSNLINNSINHGIHYFGDKYHPGFYSILFIFGAIFMFFKNRRNFYFLATWFSILWLVYFTSWFQTLGGSSRFFISFYPITVIFASYGFFLIYQILSFKIRLKKIKIGTTLLLATVLFLSFIPFINNSLGMGIHLNSGRQLETKIPELAEKEIPSNCLIVANFPMILQSTTNLNVVNIDLFLKNKEYSQRLLSKTNCLLFFEDYCCLDWSKKMREKCKKMHSEYQLTPYLVFSNELKTYTFYKISKKDNN